VSEGEKASALRETMKQEVQLYKGAQADAFLQDKVADEMAREVAQGVLEEHKARPDRDYNACFQQWLLGKSDVLNNPIITTRGYTSYVERFPRVVNWVDAQVRLASEIKVYLVRLYTEGPRTEEEVEHEFRYLVWPLNNALRILQQARNAPTLGVEVLRGVAGGAWDPQHQTAGGEPWPAELTYMGRIPDPLVKDVPPCLHPALNPYMRDQWVYSVSYREWLAGDFSKLRGDSRELWEVVANRIYGRDDRMRKPTEDPRDPQQEGGWEGGARPEGEWDAPRAKSACGRLPMPAASRPLVVPDRPWVPAAPIPSAPEAGEEEQEHIAEGNPLVEVDAEGIAEYERQQNGVKEEEEQEQEQDRSRERFLDDLAQGARALRDATNALKEAIDAQTRGLTMAPRDSVPGAMPGEPVLGHEDLPVVSTNNTTEPEAAVARVRQEHEAAKAEQLRARAERAAYQSSLAEQVASAVARGVGAAVSAAAGAAASAAAGAGSSLLRTLTERYEGEGDGEGEGEAPSIWDDDTPTTTTTSDDPPLPPKPKKRRNKGDEKTVKEGRRWAAKK
jgi:hypothetical protein